MPELAQRPEVEEFDLELSVALAEGSRSFDGEVLPPLETTLTDAEERRVRADLRRQIARMEAELGRLFGSAFPRVGIEWGVSAPGGPRVLGVAELETVRDAIADRMAAARAELGDRAEVEQRHRELIEEMVADPAAHKWLRVSNEAIGEPGCRHWHSRPRWGLLGMLRGWWRVKLSSGCPLAGGPRPPPDGKEATQEAPTAAGRDAPGRSARGRRARARRGR